jgi:uracil DNA glycosylase
VRGIKKAKYLLNSPHPTPLHQEREQAFFDMKDFQIHGIVSFFKDGN